MLCKHGGWGGVHLYHSGQEGRGYLDVWGLAGLSEATLPLGRLDCGQGWKIEGVEGI